MTANAPAKPAHHTWDSSSHQTSCFPAPEPPSVWVRFPSPAPNNRKRSSELVAAVPTVRTREYDSTRAQRKDGVRPILRAQPLFGGGTNQSAAATRGREASLETKRRRGRLGRATRTIYLEDRSAQWRLVTLGPRDRGLTPPGRIASVHGQPLECLESWPVAFVRRLNSWPTTLKKTGQSR
jgi:hypothetical protein